MLCRNPNRSAAYEIVAVTPGGDSDDLKQQLMLLGVEPGSYRGLFAEVQKLSKRVAKLRQCLKSPEVCRSHIWSRG